MTNLSNIKSSDLIFHIKLSNWEFMELAQLIFDFTGILMAESKKDLVENRLQKRLKELKLKSFTQYLELIKDPLSQEKEHLIDEVTTNKTFFYREAEHFSFLKNNILPEYLKSDKSDIKIWSNACSSGEEVYTIAIHLQEFNKRSVNSIPYHLFGSDISTKMILEAEKGIYSENMATEIPDEILKQYFLRSVKRELSLLKFKNEYRNNIQFFPFNLTKPFDQIPMMDVIFCRNVLIYFNREIQELVIKNICSRLNNGGFLFISHSESIMGFDVPLKKVAPSIYQKI